MNGNEEMTAEETKKAELINNRLNTLLVGARENLNTMLEINGIMFGSELACEAKSEKELKPTYGWFDSVIDMLKTLNTSSLNLKNELVKLRNEFKK